MLAISDDGKPGTRAPRGGSPASPLWSGSEPRPRARRRASPRAAAPRPATNAPRTGYTPVIALTGLAAGLKNESLYRAKKDWHPRQIRDILTQMTDAAGPAPASNDPRNRNLIFMAISEFPKGRKYLISLSFRGKASVRPAQVGGFDVNIVIHGSTAVRGRGDLVAYRWALWKLTAPWTHRTRPPHLGKRCAFSTSSTGPFPSNHSRKTPKGPKIALGNPDRPIFMDAV